MEDWRKLAAEAEQRHEKIPEKRKGPDLIIRVISLLSFFAWLALLVVVVLVEKAKPVPETFFDRWMELTSQQGWNLTIYSYAFYFMLLVVFLSSFGLLLNAFRRRRKTDSWRINLILVFFIALIGIVHYLLIYKTLS